jgi:hypothetical protein
MPYRLLLTDLRVHHVGEYYQHRMTAGPYEAPFITDGNLGVIASLFSHNLKVLAARITHQPEPVLDTTDITPNNIDLVTYDVEPLVIAPYSWKLFMGWKCPKTQRTFTYTAHMERDVEMVISAYSGALKFFAMKSGLILMDEDFDVRNKDRAAEEGYQWIDRPAEEE